MGNPLFTNNAGSTFANPVDMTATTVTLVGGGGALFPQPTGSDYFMVTFITVNGTQLEICKCTARAGDTLTVIRAQEGTGAQNFQIGDQCQLRITAQTMNTVVAAVGSDHVKDIVAGTGISATGTGTVTIANTGVLSLASGTGINVSGSTGNVTVSLAGPTVNSFSAGTTGLTPSTATSGAVALAGTLNVANGGTGATTFAANNVLLGNGTSAFQVIAPGTTGNSLISNGTTWVSGSTKSVGSSGTVWNNVTSSRTYSTTYTNSNSYPIMVSIWGIQGGNVTLTIGGVSAASSGINGSAPEVNLTGIVPPGLTYSISPCSSIILWSELY
jgi:hypothetical protein